MAHLSAFLLCTQAAQEDPGLELPLPGRVLKPLGLQGAWHQLQRLQADGLYRVRCGCQLG